MRKTTSTQPVSLELIERRIYLIRGHKVMLDADLAKLYGVTTTSTSPSGATQSAFPPTFCFN